MSEEKMGEALAGAENFREIDDLSVLRGIIHQLRMSNEEYESENAELKNRLSVLEPRRSEGRGMTEMSKVEEVARAIALEDLDPETRAAVDPDKWVVSESYYALARAAIAAMRIPTPEMSIAATNVDFWVGGDDCDHEEYLTDSVFERVWNAAIDAALKE
ncbi:hypothetical protein ABCW43_18165 [Neorhizobium sp. IRAMC:178]|uniref:hypothetical protein n=1 Tax=Neorhizobium tunisiense TaxID=3144793 RepID=UPI0031F6B4A0